MRARLRIQGCGGLVGCGGISCQSDCLKSRGPARLGGRLLGPKSHGIRFYLGLPLYLAYTTVRNVNLAAAHKPTQKKQVSPTHSSPTTTISTSILVQVAS